jgi:hypothetical protein
MSMPRYLLHHHHDADEWGVAYAAFKGEPSPLRRRTAVASCLSGGHEMWWLVDAATPGDALALLPHFLATRTIVTLITEVPIL